MGVDLLRKFCMNERIQELVKQATVIRKTFYGVEHLSFDTEKFAASIIKECATVCLNTAENQFSPMFSHDSDGARVCYEKIKRHFGVES